MKSALVVTEYTPKEAAKEADHVLENIGDFMKIIR